MWGKAGWGSWVKAGRGKVHNTNIITNPNTHHQQQHTTLGQVPGPGKGAGRWARGQGGKARGSGQGRGNRQGVGVGWDRGKARARARGQGGRGKITTNNNRQGEGGKGVIINNTNQNPNNKIQTRTPLSTRGQAGRSTKCGVRSHHWVTAAGGRQAVCGVGKARGQGQANGQWQ